MIVHRIDTQHELDPAKVREGVYALESFLKPMEQVDCPVTHVFAHHIYSRQCFNPKGTLIVGKIQRFGCLVVLLSGEVSILDENGVRRVIAPAVFPSEPGAKRVVYAHEDSIFMTVHENLRDEADLDTLEEFLIVPDALNCEEPDVLTLKEALCLG
jgi:hypothetical protein